MNINLDELLVACDPPFIKGLLIEDQSTILSDCGCYDYSDDGLIDTNNTSLTTSILDKISEKIKITAKNLEYAIDINKRILSAINVTAFNLYSKYQSLSSYWPNNFSQPATFSTLILGKDGNYYSEFYPDRINPDVSDALQSLIDSLPASTQKNKLIEILDILNNYDIEASKYDQLYLEILQDLQRVSMCSYRINEVQYTLDNLDNRSVWPDWIDTALKDVDTVSNILKFVKKKTCAAGYYLDKTTCECLPSYAISDLSISIIP